MMSIDTKLQIAFLATGARVESGQKGDGFQIFFCGFILVLEAAVVAFGTRTPQIVVVA